jgi:predicted MFS family arabinose efflux permease
MTPLAEMAAATGRDVLARDATVLAAADGTKRRRGPAWQLSTHRAFALQISILVLLLAASSTPTPLYAVYEAKWHFSPITVTVVFGVYALAVLAALLTVGALSDYLGRRPVLFVALLLQAGALAIFLTAGGVPELLAARVVQGLSTGMAAGALGAGLLDLDKVRGTIANGVAPLAGTATGAFGSSLVVQYLPSPTRLVYLLLLAVVVLQVIGVVRMPETSSPKDGALASLRPQISLPANLRRPFLLAAPVLVAVWALAGFYGSLGPTLARHIVGSTSLVFGGLALLLLAGGAAVTVVLVRNTTARSVMRFGTTALLVGVSITLLGIAHASAIGFFGGSAIAGIGFGAGFQGGLRTVLPLAAPRERAGVLANVYLVCYLAMGVPAVIAGFLVSHLGLLTTARAYGVATLALAAFALLGSLVTQRLETRAGAQRNATSERCRLNSPHMDHAA